jgi:predicted transcriptional regulator
MMQKMVIKVESWEEMLNWSNELARKIDQGEVLRESCIRSFEDADDLLALFTPSRRELLAEVLRGQGSIVELSERVHRDLTDVQQDVRMLIDADIITLENDIVQPIAETVVFEPIPQLASEA